MLLRNIKKIDERSKKKKTIERKNGTINEFKLPDSDSDYA